VQTRTLVADFEDEFVGFVVYEGAGVVYIAGNSLRRGIGGC
jgi:hypothetical protein